MRLRYTKHRYPLLDTDVLYDNIIPNKRKKDQAPAYVKSNQRVLIIGTRPLSSLE